MVVKALTIFPERKKRTSLVRTNLVLLKKLHQHLKTLHM
jgi:hypothetical protein